jgi:hypothetical protein
LLLVTRWCTNRVRLILLGAVGSMDVIGVLGTLGTACCTLGTACCTLGTVCSTPGSECSVSPAASVKMLASFRKASVCL